MTARRWQIGPALGAATLWIALWPANPGAQIELPGTQPGDLTVDIRSPELCRNCHGDYADYAAFDTWSGTMMANATRDPLFHAALTIAGQDQPGAGDLCIRCHSPRGWLFGRSMPADGSALEGDDFEGVSCDFCHRVETGPDGEILTGNAQYFVADDQARRGPLRDAESPHESIYSEIFEQSEFCSMCHDVSNPLQGGFAIERTYTEWSFSAYPEQGITCQSCHLPAVPGEAAGARNMPLRDVHRHELAGGNAWMPLVLAAEHPELGREEAYRRTAENARAMLQSAAILRVDAPAEVASGGELAFSVRVENRTGHKLPTGYPEGRLAWLRVRVSDGAGRLLLESGAYDAETAERADDPQLRTYEVRMAADGEEGFHFILQNELLQDNRIPPLGFVATDDTRPVGRIYPEQPDGTLANWDLAPYRVGLPSDAQTPLSIEATFLYQTASREYVEFLRDANVTDDRGERMLALWEEHGRSPPVEAASDATEVAVISPEESGCNQAGRWNGSTPCPLCGLILALSTVWIRRKGGRHDQMGSRV